MGRIGTTLVKRSGNELIEKFLKEFKADFKHNKKALEKVSTISSKKLRNVIAGYITRKVKQKKK